MSSSRKRAGIKKRQVVIEKVAIKGLEGAVEFESRSEPTIEGFQHELAYRNWMGEQLRILVRSTLDGSTQRYVPEALTDAVSKKGLIWTHHGSTPSGSVAEQSGRASVMVPEVENRVGSASIYYEVSNWHPMSAVYSHTIPVPLS